jgi:hypothetical protein
MLSNVVDTELFLILQIADRFYTFSCCPDKRYFEYSRCTLTVGFEAEIPPSDGKIELRIPLHGLGF